MKNLKIKLFIAGFIFCVSSSTVFADKAIVSLEVPNSVKSGTEITIKAYVKHSANNFFHYTQWVSIMVNGEEIARWDYNKYKKPLSKKFTKEIKYIITDDIIIQAEASCNIHGSKKKEMKKVFIK